MERKVIRLYDDNSLSNIFNILEWLAKDIDDEDDKPTNKVEPKKVEPKKTASKIIKDVRPDVGTSYTKKDEKNFQNGGSQDVRVMAFGISGVLSHKGRVKVTQMTQQGIWLYDEGASLVYVIKPTQE